MSNTKIKICPLKDTQRLGAHDRSITPAVVRGMAAYAVVCVVAQPLPKPKDQRKLQKH